MLPFHEFEIILLSVFFKKFNELQVLFMLQLVQISRFFFITG